MTIAAVDTTNETIGFLPIKAENGQVVVPAPQPTAVAVEVERLLRALQVLVAETAAAGDP